MKRPWLAPLTPIYAAVVQQPVKETLAGKEACICDARGQWSFGPKPPL